MKRWAMGAASSVAALSLMLPAGAAVAAWTKTSSGSAAAKANSLGAVSSLSLSCASGTSGTAAGTLTWTPVNSFGTQTVKETAGGSQSQAGLSAAATTAAVDLPKNGGTTYSFTVTAVAGIAWTGAASNTASITMASSGKCP